MRKQLFALEHYVLTVRMHVGYSNTIRNTVIGLLAQYNTDSIACVRVYVVKDLRARAHGVHRDEHLSLSLSIGFLSSTSSFFAVNWKRREKKKKENRRGNFCIKFSSNSSAKKEKFSRFRRLFTSLRRHPTDRISSLNLTWNI